MESRVNPINSVGRRRIVWRDRKSNLCAILVLDSVVRGPAVGGIRTMSYNSYEDAMFDADVLARSMTLKCALAGLQASGGKIVIMDHENLKREEAFSFLGKRIEELSGEFRTAGDFGTTKRDLETMAGHCQYVHTNDGELARSTALGVTACIEACVRVKGKSSLAGLRVGIQGCGSIGSALAEQLHALGVELFVADIDSARVEECAKRFSAKVLNTEEILMCCPKYGII